MVSPAPDAGDLIWISMSPQAGQEQAGRRPALVLSPKRYNDKAGLLLAVPVTTKAKGYPFEVALPGESSIVGVILADQVRSLDWRARRAEISGSAPKDVLTDVLQKLRLLLPVE
jgi:mRNA interferase MazF